MALDKKLERLLNTLYILQRNPGIKSHELAEIVGVGVRTVQRYLSELRSAGFAIDSSTGAAGGFRARGEYYLKPLTFTGPEAIALLVASKVLLGQEGFPYREHLTIALEKISGAILPRERPFVEKLEPQISLLVDSLRNYLPWGETFQTINGAILNRQSLRIDYDSYSGGGRSSRLVNPYHVLFREHYWYLVGYCHTRQEIRIFRIDRIVSLAETDQQFTLPDNFSIKDFMNNSWQLAKGEEVMVKIKFYPPITRLIREGIWHHSQQIEELPGDELIFTVTVEGTWEIKKWLLSWGKYAEVLEPQGLREEFAGQLGEMMGKYIDP